MAKTPELIPTNRILEPYIIEFISVLAEGFLPEIATRLNKEEVTFGQLLSTIKKRGDEDPEKWHYLVDCLMDDALYEVSIGNPHGQQIATLVVNINNRTGFLRGNE